MVLIEVLLGFTLIWGSGANFMKPVERCVPTAVARGACHECVCRVDGVYYCRARACDQNNSSLVTAEFIRECEPNRQYRDDATFCSCSKNGYWVSHNCRERYRTLERNAIRPIQKLRTNIACTPKSLYLLDCNVCECGQNGVIELSSCTNRRCKRGHKIEPCNHGDILRTNDELCTCSDVNIYIDRLCLGVSDTAVQPINKTDLEILFEIGKTWTRTDEIDVQTCDAGSVIVFDCNRCFCTDGKVWACTMKGCVPPEENNLRARGNNDFYSLPILANEYQLCEPGKQYRHNCNSCICSKKRIAVCTTMLCLEDIVLDKEALERSYREVHSFAESQ